MIRLILIFFITIIPISIFITHHTKYGIGNGWLLGDWLEWVLDQIEDWKDRRHGKAEMAGRGQGDVPEIEEIYRETGLGLTDFMRLLNLRSYGYINEICRCEVEPSKRIIMALYYSLRINPGYILTGYGSKKIPIEYVERSRSDLIHTEELEMKKAE